MSKEKTIVKMDFDDPARFLKWVQDNSKHKITTLGNKGGRFWIEYEVCEADQGIGAFMDELVLEKDQLEIFKDSFSKVNEEYEALKQITEKMFNVSAELAKEANDLMDFCIDRKYLNNEDLTDGQKLFNATTVNYYKVISEYQQLMSKTKTEK